MKKCFLLLVLLLVFVFARPQVPTLYIPVGHNEAIADAAFTKDGAWLFSASKDKTLKIWETTTGREVKTIPNILSAEDKFADNINSFCSSPSGKWVASFSYFVNMLISTDDLAVKKGFKIEGSNAGDFSPDESYLVVATGGTLVQVNLKDYSQKLVYSQNDPGYFTKVKISQDGKWLLVISYQNRKAIVFNTSNWQKVAEFSGNKSIFGLSPAGAVIQVDQLETQESLITAYNLPAKTVAWQKTVPSVYSGTNNSLDFSRQNAKGILGNGQGNILFDYQTGDFNQILFSEQKLSFAGLKLYPSGNSMLVCYNDRGEIRMELVDLPNNYVIRSFVNRGFNPFDINVSPVSSDFVAGSNGSTIGIANEGGHISAVGLEKKNSGSYSKFSGDGKLLFILEKGISKVITVFDWKSRKELRKISYKRDIRTFAVSYDGSRIAFHEENSIDIANSSDGAVFQSISTLRSDAGYVDNLQLSPDGSKVISYIVNENEGRTVNMWNVATGALVWSLPEYYVAEIFYLPGDKALMFRTWKKGLVMIDPETGGVLAVSEKPFMKNNFIAVSRDGKRGLVQNETSGKFELWDLQSGVMKGNMAIGEEKNRSVSFKFLTNSKMAVSRIFNTIIWWDTETLKEVARMMLFRHSNDWVLYTVDGHFDATPFAMKSLYYTRGKEVIPFDALYENYYTPNLLLKLMEGIPLPVPGNEIKDLKKAPVVKITYAAVQRNLVVDEDLPFYRNSTGAAEITVIADAPEDGIDEIRVFHNGKIVNLVTRNLIVAEDSKSKSVTKKYTINLLPGQNTIRALALNTQRTESKPDEIAVYYKNEQNPQNPPSKRPTGNSGFVAEIDKSATLHLIVVGINKYQNSSMSLNYALADATTFKQELEQDAKTVVAEIKTHFITDDQANKPGITDAFESVAKNALPQDVFLFYYAGHGVINKSSNEFYLVPNDITDLKNVNESLVQKGIAARLLQEYATKIAAQKQLFILDACQSAGAFQSIITEDAGKQKSIAIVARTTGTHWIAASGAQQFANEFSQLGHGAFTYVLLEALKGSAATDKMITVNGLKDYLQLGVPELMKKYSGTLQYPASYGFGNDFPVEKLQ